MELLDRRTWNEENFAPRKYLGSTFFSRSGGCRIVKLAPSSAHVISLSSMSICQSLVRNAGAFGNDISSCCERDELVSSHDARLISARSVAFVIGRFSSTESPAEELLLFGEEEEFSRNPLPLGAKAPAVAGTEAIRRRTRKMQEITEKQ